MKKSLTMNITQIETNIIKPNFIYKNIFDDKINECDCYIERMKALAGLKKVYQAYFIFK